MIKVSSSDLTITKQEVIDLCARVFTNDKSEFDYQGKYRLDRNGRENPTPGQRFATPLEMVQEFARKHGFHSEMWERIREIGRERLYPE